jgi:4-amino-4-deoxy-L-arabinose transferase-like glycosyltransferase
MDTPLPASSSRRTLVLEILTVLAFCGFAFFFGLGAFGLVGPDEPRYAQIAREMLRRDDWITPTLHDVSWLEKPALYYWRAMFAFRTFGVHDWAARLPSATFATAMVVIIFFHMRRFRPGAQLDAALIAITSAGIIGFARGASTDMQLAAPFTIAMLGWYAWYETGSKFWLLDLYFFIAVATLAKGPVAVVLAGVVIAVFALLRRDWKLILRTIWWPGVVLFLAMVLPWFIAVQLKNPQFFRVFILEHNLARFGSDMYRHAQPFWYYLPVALIALLPWSLLAVIAFYDGLRDAVRQWRTHDRQSDSFPEFLTVWAIVPLLFFSISQSKLPGYILPAIPPFAILLASYLQRKRHQLSNAILAAHALLASAMVGLLLMLPYTALRQEPTTAAKVTAGVAVGVVLFAMYFTLRRAGKQYLRFVTLAPVVLCGAYLLRPAAPVLDAVYSARPVAEELSAIGKPDAPVAVFRTGRDLEYGLGFYRDRYISRYERGEVPPRDHLLITTETASRDMKSLLGERRATPVGKYPAQRLEYYWIFTPRSQPAPEKPQP